MKRLETFNTILREIQSILLIIFLLFGCAFFLTAIAVLIPKSKGLETDPVEERIEQETEEVIEIVEEPLTHEQEMFLEYEALSQIEDKKEWFLAYKVFIEKYPEYDRPQSLYEKYTDEEIYIMQRVIETEVYGCDFEAKANVASVILNRIEGDNNFSDDPIVVCTSPGQFVYSRKQISEDTKLALEYAEEIEDTTNGALYFNSMEPMESWNGRERIFTDHVGHSFY